MKPETLAKMKKSQAEAHKRLLERSKIEFRADPELMGLLLARAKEKFLPVGPMVRDMVKAQLDLEAKKSPTQLDKIESKIDKLLSQKLA